MLVLSRKVGERVKIGQEIELTVVRIGPNAVRLGIKAPNNLVIVREELEVIIPCSGVCVESPIRIPTIAELSGAGMWDGEPI